MRRVTFFMVVLFLLASCSQPAAKTEIPTATFLPDPTPTPLPSPTPEPIPEPVVYEGSGDTMLPITKPIEGDMCFMYVEGNAAGEFFGMVSYDEKGNLLHKLIVTEEPYTGTRLLDGSPDNNSAALEIRATGPWRITLIPVIPPYISDFIVDVPGQLSGSGDVVVLTRGQSSVISANYSGNMHFVIFAHGIQYGGLVFNEQGTFAGEVTLPENTVMLEIMAEGNWDIDIK